MKIQNDCIVEISYEMYDNDGQLAESSKEDGNVSYLQGLGEILPGLEAALAGHSAGEHVEVEIDAENAFGDYDPEGLISVPRSEFPPDAEIVPGDWIEVSVSENDQQADEQGEEEEIEMRVVEISPEAVVLDANHPLAGKNVKFQVDVVSVRAATAEELEQAREVHEHDEHCGHAQADEE